MIAREEFTAAARLLAGLAPFLHRRFTPEEGRAEVRRRLATRRADFLELLRRAVFDYQLVEEEDAHGHPRLRLLVHPRLGALDSRAVAETLLGAVGSGHGIERVTELAWRDGGVVHVERKPPIATQTGKIRHFHLERVLGSAGPPRSGV
jgi:hypothetical protein